MTANRLQAVVPVVCGSLREALGELRNDHAFLLKGDVFNMDQIEAYMELKWKEVYAFEHTPPPDRIPDVLLCLAKNTCKISYLVKDRWTHFFPERPSESRRMPTA